MVIVWSEQARTELRKAYEYILQGSYQNAIKVSQEIVDAVLSLPANPGKYPLDKYKRDNDGTWRAFELHRYRISYRALPNEIRVVRMRHTKRNPLLY